LFEKIENYDSEEPVVINHRNYDFKKYSNEEITERFLKIWQRPNIPIPTVKGNNETVSIFKRIFNKIFKN